MIQLLDRLSILRQNDTFAAFIVGYQEAIYNPSAMGNLLIPGQVFHDGKVRIATQIDCDRMNAEANEEFDRVRDKIDASVAGGVHVGDAILGFPTQDEEELAARLGEAMVHFAAVLDTNPILFIGAYAIPWLQPDNTFHPLDEADQYIRSLGADDTYVGGFQASGEELKKLTKALFLLVSYNGHLPICYWLSAGKEFFAEICEYGDLHFHFYSIDLQEKILAAAREIGMSEVEQC